MSANDLKRTSAAAQMAFTAHALAKSRGKIHENSLTLTMNRLKRSFEFRSIVLKMIGPR